ncbi:single-stranded-DNA-specific exonuclease RecJ [Desmospora activa]|uniref:Single-stranded-DNA-specific exonuclease RecJ n=1 Tax=Desmospora activa DSM 45169 TaxID=1121389 RepID=A0A2T4Z8V9_9BACL|nr:single-stranded-DNA-specific exonuclease RecJ [Desmospora activa]PTM58334.1 exonuclease RecJ [Desmospora activa DSM 45169]
MEVDGTGKTEGIYRDGITINVYIFIMLRELPAAFVLYLPVIPVCYNEKRQSEVTLMLRPKTRWRPSEAEAVRVDELANSLNLHPLVARLLINRGLDDVERVRRFLRASVQDLYDPFWLDGMEQAVKRIRHALEQGEKIRIYGDYDADGVTSTSLMMRVFRRLGADVDYYIPNRFTEGYGLNRDALIRAKEEGVHLMISVDTGISAVDQADHANKLGLDLIITDHHEPPSVLPQALAVINPKKPDCTYPFSQLAGVGVAFKLCHALLGEPPEEGWELVALGSIADLVPLVDENRILAARGLEAINQNPSTGMAALVEASGIDGEVAAGHVGFSLGPRINASGRLDTAGQAVELMLTEDSAEAALIAEELDRMNRERQHLVEAITAEAVALVEEEPEAHHRMIVVAAPGWNVGVIGIVASRLVERYYRPTIVLGIDEETGMAKGSARSIAGFDMYRALTACDELLPHYGGHTMAAGMSLPQRDLAQLHQRLDQLASEWLTEEDYIPLSAVDADLTLGEVNLALIESIEKLAPYGIGNPTPRFRLIGSRLERIQRIGRDKNHLKLMLEQEGSSLDAVGFRMGELAEELMPQSQPELLGELSINEWNQRRNPQFLVRDVAVPHLQIFDWRSNRDQRERLGPLAKRQETLFVHSGEEPHWWKRDYAATLLSWDRLDPNPFTDAATVRYLVLIDLPPAVAAIEGLLRGFGQLERIYFAFGDADWNGPSGVPDREHFKKLYGAVMKVKELRIPRDLERLARMTGLSAKGIGFILEVFQELGFVRREGDWLLLVPEAEKKPLSRSTHYRQQQEWDEVQQCLVYSSTRDLYTYIASINPKLAQSGGEEAWISKIKSG